MVIDTHIHFWRYTPQAFGWIGEEMAGIRRNFLPADLDRELASNGVAGVVAVQARQLEEETGWLLKLAEENRFIRGVVGWVPLVAGDVDRRLHEWAGGRLVGVRHVLQGQNDGYMQGDEFHRGLAALVRHGLVYELLISERQLPAAIQLVDRHPQLSFVLDHLGKPRNDSMTMEPWRANLRELARRRNVVCKISGGITEADLSWTPAKLRPYFDAALDAFGASRLMFGSNWPVYSAAGGYHRWLDAVRQWAGALSADDQENLFSRTAVAVYQLKELA